MNFWGKIVKVVEIQTIPHLLETELEILQGNKYPGPVKLISEL